MKQKISMALIVVFTVLLSVLLVAAEGVDDQGNNNDPNENPRANACYDGGSMAGKCDTQLEWDAGHYLIRYEFGLLSRDEIPAWVLWAIPPEIIPEELEDVVSSAPAGPTSVCADIYTGPGGSYNGGFGVFVDNILTQGTQLYYASNCQGEAYYNVGANYVIAGDSTAALALCQTINASFDLASFTGYSYACYVGP